MEGEMVNDESMAWSVLFSFVSFFVQGGKKDAAQVYLSLLSSFLSRTDPTTRSKRSSCVLINQDE